MVRPRGQSISLIPLDLPHFTNVIYVQPNYYSFPHLSLPLSHKHLPRINFSDNSAKLYKGSPKPQLRNSQEKTFFFNMPPVPEEQESSSLVSHESPEEIPDLLPKLPLPKVEESVAGFLNAIEAVVDKVF